MSQNTGLRICHHEVLRNVRRPEKAGLFVRDHSWGIRHEHNDFRAFWTATCLDEGRVFCNAIGMLSAGNAVVFNVHPSARRVSAHCVQLLNRAVNQKAVRERWDAGKQVPVAETVRGFKEILEGKHDDVAEVNFYMKGGIEEIKEA